MYMARIEWAGRERDGTVRDGTGRDWEESWISAGRCILGPENWTVTLSSSDFGASKNIYILFLSLGGTNVYHLSTEKSKLQDSGVLLCAMSHRDDGWPAERMSASSSKLPLQ